MRGIVFRALILCLFSAGSSLVAATVSKEALLIANNDYTRLPQLSNPVSDGKILGETLRNLGFRVTLLTNASREDMLDAIQGLQDRLRSSHGLAFFHYGGHGIQVDGSNYLIPANADISDDRKLRTRAVDLEEVMTSLDEAGADANIIVLDACRNNPLPKGTRSLSRGLAVVQTKPKNSIIVYAADAGHEARDGVFTPTLAKELMIPGISFQKALLEVRKQVAAQTGNNQTPADYSQLTEEIVLNSAGNTSPGELQTLTPSHVNEMPPARVRPVVFEPVSQVATINPSPATAYRQPEMQPTPAPQSYAEGDIPGLNEFFKSWVGSWCSNDPQVQVESFADVVDYCYWNHHTSRDRIAMGAENFIRNFPVRNYYNIQIHRITPLGPDEVMINYSNGYRYSGNRAALGSTNVTITVRRMNGIWKITRFTEKVSNG